MELSGMELSVVIPSYGLTALLRTCVLHVQSGLTRALPGRTAIVVVDNGSAMPYQADDLATPDVRILRLDRRHSFSAACNRGASAVPAARYDVILSNPPYEPSGLVDGQAPEFAAEPRMAHDGGADGMTIVRTLLRQARTRLAPQGVVVIEVGGLRAAIDREFAAQEPHWLPTADGTDCVCLFQAERL